MTEPAARGAWLELSLPTPRRHTPNPGAKFSLPSASPPRRSGKLGQMLCAWFQGKGWREPGSNHPSGSAQLSSALQPLVVPAEELTATLGTRGEKVTGLLPPEQLL